MVSVQSEGLEQRLSARTFGRRFAVLIGLTWVIPPLFGFAFLLFIQMFTVAEMAAIVTSAVEGPFVIVSLGLALWYFTGLVRPVRNYLATGSAADADRALRAVRRFPLHFWGIFLFYLAVAPATVMVSADMATDFAPQPVDWFRIHLVALIVSIIVGLPMFFSLFDLFGRAIGPLQIDTPVLTVKAKVFLIGSLVPLLIDTMLVQYYWTRTGFFTFETLLVWFVLELLAIAGSLIFVRSFGQSLEPLEGIVSGRVLHEDPNTLRFAPQSTDELGVLAGRTRTLLEQLHLHGEILELGNRILRSGGSAASAGEAFDHIVEICRTAMDCDLALLILDDKDARQLVGVSQSGERYTPQGHFRLDADEPSLAKLIISQAKPVAIDDLASHEGVSPRMIQQLGVHSAIGAPLKGDGEILGVLVAASAQGPRHFTKKDLAMVEGLAREASTVVHTMTLNERRQQAERRFRQVDQLASVTLQSIGDGVVTTDTEGRVEFLNTVAERLTQWSNANAQGKPLLEVLKLIDESTGQIVEDPVQRCLQRGKSLSIQGHILLLGRDDNQKFSVEVRVSPLRDADGTVRGTVLVFHDVTELRLLTRKLSYQASHDALTGLINRREFELRVERVLEHARHNGQSHALLYMDLDQFKVVNDTCGHSAGDQLLKQLTGRLRAVVRDSDTLARLGGDEFGLLLETCPLEKAKRIADDLLMMVRGFRFVWEAQAFDVGVSIGVVPITQHSGTLTDLLSAADSACYVAKDLGRNRLHVFEPDDLMLAQRQGEMRWLPRIREALEQDRLTLYIQPILPLDDKSTDGRYGELLLRMQNGDGGVIAPQSFLPAAERYHLMPAIDRWVIEHALSALAGPKGDVRSRYAINVSGQSLSEDGFLEFVKGQLAGSEVDPASICFEITETTAIANLERAREFISELKALGCRFALDDFGSGLSSFGYLKNLPVDYVKIDGSFVQDMVDNSIDRAMIDAINQIAHLMEIQTIAEYVVSAEVFRGLGELGVDFAQGFFVAEPAPLADYDPEAITASLPALLLRARQ